MKRILFIVSAISILIVGGILIYFFTQGKKVETTAPPKQEVLTYEVSPDYNFAISKLASDLGTLTRLAITPDGNTLLAATLTGEIHAFSKQNGVFVKQDQPFYTLVTNQPGLPPDESGLTGLVFGGDFDTSGDVFLLYVLHEGDEIKKNRISRVSYVQEDGNVIGKDEKVIFEANTEAGNSHQIQGGVGLMYQGKSHLLFNIGEGFKAERAKDLTKEAGKVMFIQRDGSDPLGPRPYPAQPKIQAIGLRNAYSIALNEYDDLKRFAIGDTGTSKYDRLIYARLLDVNGGSVTGIDLKWDGTDESLNTSIPDVNTKTNPEAVLHRWSPTETVNDIVFYPGGFGKIPKSNREKSHAILSIFGKTGLKKNKPGKELVVAEFSFTDSQPKITFETLVLRSTEGEGKIGNPLGVTFDPEDGSIFFADVFEGNIYKLTPKGGG